MGTIASEEFNEQIFTKAVKAMEKSKIWKPGDMSFYNVTWKGMEFSVLPFMFIGTRYREFDDDRGFFYDLYYSKFARKHLDFESVWDLVEDMQKKFGDDIFNIYECCLRMHSQDPLIGLTMLFAYENTLDCQRALTKFVLSEFCYAARDTGFKTRPAYIEDRTICNTTAFAYYITIYWLLKKVPEFQIYFKKTIQNSKIKQLLDDACPETCDMYRYFKGELTSQELLDIYDVCDKATGDCIKLREYRAVEMPGELDNHNLFESILVRSEQKDCSILGAVANAIGLVCTSNGYLSVEFKLMDEQLDRMKSEIQERLKFEAQYKQVALKNVSLESDIHELNNRVETAEETAKCAKSELDVLKRDFDKKVKDAVSPYKEQVRVLGSAVDEMESELIETKRRLKEMTKLVKQLQSNLPENTSEKLDNLVEVREEATVSEREMLDTIRGKSIAILGGYNLDGFKKRALKEKLNISYYLEESSADFGTNDIYVILATSIKHRLVRCLQSKGAGNRIVYMNGTNFSNFINLVYERLIDEE